MDLPTSNSASSCSTKRSSFSVFTGTWHVPVKTEKDERFVEQLEAEFEVGKSINDVGLRRSFDLKVHRNLLRKVQEAVLVLELFDGQPLENAAPHKMDEIA